MANNLLFGALAFVVLLGTVFPLIAEALDGSRLRVGRPYFDSMSRPIGLAILFLMAAAPVLPWRKASTELLSKRLFWPALAGVAAMAAALIIGGRGIYPILTFGLGGFAAGAALRQVILATKRQGWRGFVGRTNGGMIVHLGVVLLAVGMAASESYRSDQTVVLTPGESAVVEGRRFTYLEPGVTTTDRETKVFALIDIDGEGSYAPAITNYPKRGSTVATPSVRSRPTHDVFLVLDDLPSRADDTIRLRIVIRPMVMWLWVGGAMMAFGTLLALFPGRRRRGTEPVSEPLGKPKASGPPESESESASQAESAIQAELELESESQESEAAK